MANSLKFLRLKASPPSGPAPLIFNASGDDSGDLAATVRPGGLESRSYGLSTLDASVLPGGLAARSIGIGALAADIALTVSGSVGYDIDVPDWQAGKLTSAVTNKTGSAFIWLESVFENRASIHAGLRASISAYPSKWADLLAKWDVPARVSNRLSGRQIAGRTFLQALAGQYHASLPLALALAQGSVAYRLPILLEELAGSYFNPPVREAFEEFSWRIPKQLNVSHSIRYRAGRILYRSRRFRFQEGHVPWPGISPSDYVPPSPPPPPFVPHNELAFRFSWKAGNALIFNRSGYAVFTIAIKRVYFVSNNFSLYRLPDGYNLPAESISIKTDADSWCWSLSGALASLSALDSVAITEAGPVVLRAHVNGVDWDFIVDDPEGEEAWDNNSSAIHGRSRTALFDEPYYPALNYSNDADRQYSQLAGDLFVYNGVSLGVSVSSSLADWIIPAGGWSFAGTPVAGIKRLAEAPGAIVTSARTGLGFSLEHRYPTLPWNWAAATPWASIPRAYWIGHSHRRQTRPMYDLVIVGGDTGNGILAPVQRDGSAGAWPAPQIIDRLITGDAAARQRGAAVLANTGRQSIETISLPIGAEFGLIPLNALIELQDTVTWRGLVRSVAVSVRMQGDAMDIMQTLEVERHHA